ncbi:phage terminase large subunit family protein, partial [Lacticaseibacillus rhamnosus]|uniref:phage terminase large subunit family protein n=1 Tax=Lacticaseibacillus rhamnosus TaxID=47715 RepID=UPI0019508FBE
YKKLFGDVKVLLDIRRQRFGDDSMLLALSHPDLAKGLIPERDWTAGIMSMYADSTRCVWYWECPECRAWSSPCPIAARVMSIEYPQDGTLDEIQHGAYLLCPVNG